MGGDKASVASSCSTASSRGSRSSSVCSDRDSFGFSSGGGGSVHQAPVAAPILGCRRSNSSFSISSSGSGSGSSSTSCSRIKAIIGGANDFNILAISENAATGHDLVASCTTTAAAAAVAAAGSGGRRRGVLTLYVKAGCDGRKYGACPLCQRIFMLLMLKVSQGAQLKFRVATVPSSRLPDEFRANGLRNLPAIIYGWSTAIDTVEEIADFIEAEFSPQKGPLAPSWPSLLLDGGHHGHGVAGNHEEDLVDKLARNFFSKFCFYIKSVSRDPGALLAELGRLDQHLRGLNTRYLFGDCLSRLDCEVLPKLHHLRVASAKLKRLEIPPHDLTGIWRYLNNAYNDAIFRQACPSDQEIVLHWAGRPDTPGLSYKEHSLLTRDAAEDAFSFDVPAIATPVNVG